MKSIFASKTFWLNLLSGIAVVSGLIPANPYTIVAGAVANIILRTVTNQPVSVPILNPVPVIPMSTITAISTGQVKVLAEPISPIITVTNHPVLSPIPQSTVSITGGQALPLVQTQKEQNK